MKYSSKILKTISQSKYLFSCIISFIFSFCLCSRRNLLCWRELLFPSSMQLLGNLSIIKFQIGNDYQKVIIYELLEDNVVIFVVISLLMSSQLQLGLFCFWFLARNLPVIKRNWNHFIIILGLFQPFIWLTYWKLVGLTALKRPQAVSLQRQVNIGSLWRG